MSERGSDEDLLNGPGPTWAHAEWPRLRQVRSVAASIISLDWSSIEKVGPNPNSPISLESGRWIKVILEFCRKLPYLSVEFCEMNVLHEIEGKLQQVLEFSKDVQSTIHQDWTRSKQQIVNTFNTQIKPIGQWAVGFMRDQPHLFSALYDVDRISSEYKAEFVTIRSKIDDEWSGIQKRLNASNEAIEKAISESNKALSAAKVAAIGNGVSAQSKFFNDLVTAYGESAYRSLKMVFALAIMTIAVAVYFQSAERLSNTATTPVVIAERLPHAVILSVFITLLTLAIRSYLAAKHNEVTNRLRATAVNTFMAFWQAPLDQSVKDAVLLRACSCVFDHQPTGFSKAAESGGDSSRIIEISRQFNPSTKPTVD